MRPLHVVFRAILAGCFGSLVFLCVNTAANMMQSCGSSNFVSWVGSKLHEKVIQLGDKWGQKAYRGPGGEDNWTMVAPHIKLKYYVGPGMTLGFLVGAAAGVALAWRERRKGLREFVDKVLPGGGAGSAVPPGANVPVTHVPPPSAEAAGAGAISGRETGGAAGLPIPWHWPLLIAMIGLLFHGYLLGLIAVVLAGRVPARPWQAWLTRVVGAFVVLFWGLGTEMWWGPGWSTIYRGLADFLKMFFAGVGME
ncbi:MAG: hypothetical protein N3A38_12870 [Planctomycetota bacterium]|nr:hypothetical protein [Planctomycetota bacterium]